MNYYVRYCKECRKAFDINISNDLCPECRKKIKEVKEDEEE